MALLEFNFYPETHEESIESSIVIPDDLDVYDMFEIWKRQMSMLGYMMDKFELTKEEIPDGDYLVALNTNGTSQPPVVDTTTGDAPFKDEIVITSESK